MFFERISTAVREAYTGRADIETQREAARAYRKWAEGLAVEPSIRAALIEPIAAVESGLDELLRRAGRAS